MYEHVHLSASSASSAVNTLHAVFSHAASRASSPAFTCGQSVATMLNTTVSRMRPPRVKDGLLARLAAFEKNG